MTSPQTPFNRKQKSSSLSWNGESISYLGRNTNAVSKDDDTADTSKTYRKSSSTSSSSLSSSTEEGKLAGTPIRNQDASQTSLTGDITTSCLNHDHIFQKVSCYSTQHPVWSFSLAFASLCILYYVFVSKRRPTGTTRRWRPWVRQGALGENAKGEYAAVSVYDELLDEFDKDDLSSYDGSIGEGSFHSDGDSDDEDNPRSRGNHWNKSNKGRGIEMIPYDDGRLNLREING